MPDISTKEGLVTFILGIIFYFLRNWNERKIAAEKEKATTEAERAQIERDRAFNEAMINLGERAARSTNQIILSKREPGKELSPDMVKLANDTAIDAFKTLLGTEKVQHGIAKYGAEGFDKVLKIQLEASVHNAKIEAAASKTIQAITKPAELTVEPISKPSGAAAEPVNLANPVPVVLVDPASLDLPKTDPKPE